MTTGFICFLEQLEDTSAVLVTSSRVLDNEEIPTESEIKFNGVDAPLNMKPIVIKTSYAYSHKKKVSM